LFGDAGVAVAVYVATVTVKTRTRREILTTRSQLLNTLGWGYASALDRKLQKEVPPGPMKTPHLS
jgi:hypothetical protein